MHWAHTLPGCLLGTPRVQAHLLPDSAQQWGTFWMLTGAESLCVTALGLPVRASAAEPHSRRSACLLSAL
jgi:hypothetical protein